MNKLMKVPSKDSEIERSMMHPPASVCANILVMESTDHVDRSTSRKDGPTDGV